MINSTRSLAGQQSSRTVADKNDKQTYGWGFDRSLMQYGSYGSGAAARLASIFMRRPVVPCGSGITFFAVPDLISCELLSATLLMLRRISLEQ